MNTHHLTPRNEGRAGYLFLMPFFVLFGVFGILPILFTIGVSFFDWDLLGEPTFVGIANYTELFADSRFYDSIGNTFSIFLLSSVPQIVAALLLAVLLNSKSVKLKIFWRSVILFPFITSTVAVAVVFGAMFADNGGMMNWGLGLIGLDPVGWHSDTIASHIVIALMVNWRWTGYNTLIFLAALQAIPNELYEAAEVDGASGWRQFIDVTVPQIRPTLFFVIVTSTIGGLQVFAEPYIFGNGNYSGGSSGQFSTITLLMFDQAFAQMRLGYSAAIAMALFVLIAVVAAINFLLGSKMVKGEQ